ncbi:MAG: hypothetical protein WBG48_18760 [Pricia sp.]
MLAGGMVVPAGLGEGEGGLPLDLPEIGVSRFGVGQFRGGLQKAVADPVVAADLGAAPAQVRRQVEGRHVHPVGAPDLFASAAPDAVLPAVMVEPKSVPSAEPLQE